jgi:hypothetical protein
MSNMPATFPVAAGEVRLRGAFVAIDETTGRATSIRRVDEAGPAGAGLSAPERKAEPETSVSGEEV